MDVIHLRQDFDEIRLQSVVRTLCFSRVRSVTTKRAPGHAENSCSLAIPLPSLMPIAPEVFFGRDGLVSRLLYETTRIALLGALGSKCPPSPRPYDPTINNLLVVMLSLPLILLWNSFRRFFKCRQRPKKFFWPRCIRHFLPRPLCCYSITPKRCGSHNLAG